MESDTFKNARGWGRRTFSGVEIFGGGLFRELILRGINSEDAINIAHGFSEKWETISILANSHPNIVSLFRRAEVGEHMHSGYEVYTFFEFINGPSAAGLSIMEGFNFSQLPPIFQYQIFNDVIRALEEIHEIGFLLNFSPVNIRFEIETEKDCQFDEWIKKVVVTGVEYIKLFRGRKGIVLTEMPTDRSWPYSPAERFYSKAFDERTVVYSVALTFLDLMTKLERLRLGDDLIGLTRFHNQIVNVEGKLLPCVNPAVYISCAYLYSVRLAEVFIKATSIFPGMRHNRLSDFSRDLALAMLDIDKVVIPPDSQVAASDVTLRERIEQLLVVAEFSLDDYRNRNEAT